MTVRVIYASTKKGVMGYKGKLPWIIPEDLQRFKLYTFNHAVIMGRLTWESLPIKTRPLPNRTNIVVSKTVSKLPGAKVAKTIREAIELANNEDVWVIGGASIIKEALPYTFEIKHTLILNDIKGDVTIDPIDLRVFEPVMMFPKLTSNNITYRHINYKRIE